MEPVRIRATTQADGDVLGCPRCAIALLPEGELPRAGHAKLICPLCGLEQIAVLVEVGEAFPYNLQQQVEDVAASPIYQVEAITYDEDLCLVDAPALLEDPAFFALQDGVAPVQSFGWVGGRDLLESPEYRLFLVVRVYGQPEADLFRLEFPSHLLPALARLGDDQTMVLVSQRKGVLFGEAGEIYLEAVREAGGAPGGPIPLNSWAALEE